MHTPAKSAAHGPTDAAGARALPALLGLLGLALLVGGLAAPPVFRGLLWLGRHVSGWEGLREVEFEKVAARCVMAALLALAAPVLKWGGMLDRRRLGLGPVEGEWGRLGKGWWLGVVTLGVPILAGWMLKAYVPRGLPVAGWVGGAAGFLLVGLAVGVTEELFFRGVVFGCLRPLGRWPAVLLSSAFYAGIHFAKPLPPLGVVHPRWYSGYELLPHLLAGMGVTKHPLPVIITLFFAGMILALLYEREGHLFLVMGLHAGWVFAIQMGGHVLQRDASVLPALFGREELVAQSNLALLLAALFFGVVLAGFRPGARANPGREAAR